MLTIRGANLIHFKRASVSKDFGSQPRIAFPIVELKSSTFESSHAISPRSCVKCPKSYDGIEWQFSH